MWSYSPQIVKIYTQTIPSEKTDQGKISTNYFPNLNFQFESKSITIKPNTFSTQTLVYLKTHNLCFFTLREEDTDLPVLKITPFFIEEDTELTIREELFYMVQGETAENQHYQIQKVDNLRDIRKRAKLATFITNGPRTPLLDRAPLVFDVLGNVVGILTEPLDNSLTKFECRQLASIIDKDIIEWINKKRIELIDKDRIEWIDKDDKDRIEWIEYVSRPFNRSQSVLDQ